MLNGIALITDAWSHQTVFCYENDSTIWTSSVNHHKTKKGEKMATPPIVVRKKKTPEISVQKTEKPLIKHPEKPTPVTSGSQDKPEKPKGPTPVDKASQYYEYIKEIESIPSPGREIAGVCFYLCYLINENRNSTTLFPLKDEVLEKIYRGGYRCLMVSHVKRGDRLTYQLPKESREKWESETGGKVGLSILYRTPDSFVQIERGYYDLYQFHIVVEPFRFLFYMPVGTASWVTNDRILKPTLYASYTSEHGLLRGKSIKISRKSTNTTDEQLGYKIKKFLNALVRES